MADKPKNDARKDKLKSALRDNLKKRKGFSRKLGDDNAQATGVKLRDRAIEPGRKP